MLRTDKGKPDTTARHVLQALAEHAHPDGSNAHPSVLRIQYRTGYDRATVQRALRRLEKGDLIKRDGAVGGRTSWRLAMELQRPASDWKQVESEEEGERAAAAERKRRSRSRVTHAKSVTVTDAEGVTVTHAESVTPPVGHAESGRHALKVRDVTHSKSGRHAPSAAQTTNQPSVQPSVNKDSSSAPPQGEPDDDLFGPLAAASEAAHNKQRDYAMEKFGAFRLNYPRKKSFEKAKEAWRRAIDRGADPDHMVEAAAAYAQERAGEPAQYTPYPATWLDNGRYDDEPDPKQPQRPGGVRNELPTADEIDKLTLEDVL